MRLTLLALLLARAALATDADLLRLAVRAEESLPRVGTQRIEVMPGGATVVSDLALAFDGQGHSSRRHTSGPSVGLAVVTDGAWEWRRSPGSDLWQRGPNLETGGRSLAAAVDRLLANYRLAREEGGEVAGRATHLLRISPRMAGNPSRRLWIDQATRLVLRSEVLNRDGVLTSRTQYTALTYRRPATGEVSLPQGAPRADNTPPGALVPAGSLDERDRTLGRRSLRPATLPAGYAFQEAFLRACRQGGWTPVTTWSDGLNVISVMEPAGRGAGGRGGGRGRGAGRRCQVTTSRLQVVVRATVAGREVVVVGDLPRERLEALALSLR